MTGEICPVCGGPWDGFNCHCLVCLGWCCPVCEEPAYRDESVTYTGLGKTHMRCSSGEPRPRPERMGDPMDVALKEAA